MVVVIVALLATGRLSNGGNETGGAIASDAALRIAISYASTVAGGPWNLTSVLGVDLSLAHTVSVIGLVGRLNPDCTVNGALNFTIPAYSGNYSDGDFEAWELSFENASGMLYVAVVHGQVADHFEEWGGPLCAASRPPQAVALNTSGVSSSLAAAVALHDPDVSGFTSIHSTADAEVDLFGGEWNFDYTTCDFFYDPGAAVRGSTALVAVNETEGSEVAGSSSLALVIDCARAYWAGEGVPMSDLLVLGNATRGLCPAGDSFIVRGCFGGDYTYSLKVRTSYLSYDGIVFQVLQRTEPTPAYYNVTGPGGFSVLTTTGAMAAETEVPSGEPLLMGQGFSRYGLNINFTDLIAPNETILLDMGTASPSGLGLSLEVSCIGLFLASPPFYAQLL